MAKRQAIRGFCGVTKFVTKYVTKRKNPSLCHTRPKREWYKVSSVPLLQRVVTHFVTGFVTDFVTGQRLSKFLFLKARCCPYNGILTGFSASSRKGIFLISSLICLRSWLLIFSGGRFSASLNTCAVQIYSPLSGRLQYSSINPYRSSSMVDRSCRSLASACSSSGR